jgi:hypothetical protein
VESNKDHRGLTGGERCRCWGCVKNNKHLVSINGAATTHLPLRHYVEQPAHDEKEQGEGLSWEEDRGAVLGIHGEEGPQCWLCGEDERSPAGFHGRCRAQGTTGDGTAVTRAWMRAGVACPRRSSCALGRRAPCCRTSWRRGVPWATASSLLELGPEKVRAMAGAEGPVAKGRAGVREARSRLGQQRESACWGVHRGAHRGKGWLPAAMPERGAMGRGGRPLAWGRGAERHGGRGEEGRGPWAERREPDEGGRRPAAAARGRRSSTGEKIERKRKWRLGGRWIKAKQGRSTSIYRKLLGLGFLSGLGWLGWPKTLNRVALIISRNKNAPAKFVCAETGRNRVRKIGRLTRPRV